jgi:hypothetical protein
MNDDCDDECMTYWLASFVYARDCGSDSWCDNPHHTVHLTDVLRFVTNRTAISVNFNSAAAISLVVALQLFVYPCAQ